MFVINTSDKETYVIHERSLKQALNHRLLLKKVHRAIQFNQEVSLNHTLEWMISKNRSKNDFEKDFFKLINNAVFGKTTENGRKHRAVKLVATDKRRNQLVSEANYHTTKWFSEDLFAREMWKTKIKMNIRLVNTRNYQNINVWISVRLY